MKSTLISINNAINTLEDNQKILNSLSTIVEDSEDYDKIVASHKTAFQKTIIPAIVFTILIIACPIAVITIMYLSNPSTDMINFITLVGIGVGILFFIFMTIFLVATHKKYGQPFAEYSKFYKRSDKFTIPIMEWESEYKMHITNMPPPRPIFTIKNIIFALIVIVLTLIICGDDIRELVDDFKEMKQQSEDAKKWQETQDNLAEQLEKLEQIQENLDNIQTPEVDIPKIEIPEIPEIYIPETKVSESISPDEDSSIVLE